MDTSFSNAVFYMFHISTILLNVLVINSKGETVSGYFSKNNFTWTDAKRECNLAGLQEKINVTVNNRELGWVDASATYSPWVEYFGCYNIKESDLISVHRTSTGSQLLECLQTCKDNFFIGLQHTNCSCIKNITISKVSVHNVCNAEVCKGDDDVLCGNGTKSKNDFVIYEKVTIDEVVMTGNCLSVIRQKNRVTSFQTSDCKKELYQICKHDHYSGFFSIENRQKTRWLTSHKQCTSTRYLASYNTIKGKTVGRTGTFWLANIRKPIIQIPPDPNPKYCIAVHNDNKVISSVRSCNQTLHAICISLPGKFDGTDNKKITNGILIIVLVIIASCAVVVVIVITVLIIRMRNSSSRIGSPSMTVSNNQVVYAMVNKPKTTSKKQEFTGKETAGNTENDDTYDHMEHNRSSQDQNNECNYDTMQSVGTEKIENDYDMTNGKEIDGQFMIDDSAEYSHVEVAHQVKE